MQKRVFGQMRRAKDQISLHIHTVCSGPLKSANRIIGHYTSMESKCPDETENFFYAFQWNIEIS